MAGATVTFKPVEDGRLVTLKPCWVADNGYETAVFVTQGEAIAFCQKRWRVSPEQVKVTGPTDAPPSGEGRET